jgi:hypothetical protein
VGKIFALDRGDARFAGDEPALFRSSVSRDFDRFRGDLRGLIHIAFAVRE